MYDYLKNLMIRVPDKKELLLQLPSVILPVTSKRSEIPCCGYYAALDMYKGETLVCEYVISRLLLNISAQVIV